jgi:glycosyltransferase involved in cell wall biosynthesis
VRALTVIAEMGSGGAETVVDALTRHLVATGHDVDVASSGGWRADRLAADGVRMLDVPLRGRGPVALARSVARLRRETARRPVDLVHAHNVRASAAAHGSRVGRRDRPPLITTVHGLAGEDYPRAARLLDRTSELVVAVSADVADRLTDAGLHPDRLRVVENAVPPAPDGDRDEVRRALGLDVHRPVVLCAARLAPPKRLDLLIEAWAGLDALLLVAGDGPDRADLEARAAGLGDRVVFLGNRTDVGRLLHAADLLVLPSDREGLSMTVLEAMAAGVPVVASDVGGLSDLAGAVELVAPGHAEALAAGVRRVLADGERRAALLTRSDEVVGQRFSSVRMMAAYESLYRDVLRTRRS